MAVIPSSPPTLGQHCGNAEHGRCAAHRYQADRIQPSVRPQHEQADARRAQDASDDLNATNLSTEQRHRDHHDQQRAQRVDHGRNATWQPVGGNEQ